MRTIEERFWSKVKHRLGGCWEWTAGNRRGYGQFWLKGRMRSAHRVSYEMEHGSILDGLYVCHTCDNPSCVRPSHLFIGTQKDNIMDAHSKGRLRNGTSIGSMHGRSKLVEEQVSIILKDNRSHKKIAKDYKVSRSTVSLIKKRKIWKHVR